MELTRPVRIALSLVVHTETGLAWAEGGLERVREALREEPGELSLQGLVRLSAALRVKHDAPSMADELCALLRELPLAREAISKWLAPTSSIDATRGFAKREGRPIPVRAPSGNDLAPAGCIPATTLIDPSGHDRARVRSRARKEAKHGHF